MKWKIALGVIGWVVALSVFLILAKYANPGL